MRPQFATSRPSRGKEGAFERQVLRPGRPAYVRALPSAAGKPSSELLDTLAARIVARRERLRAKVGTFSVHDDIRELRENVPR